MTERTSKGFAKNVLFSYSNKVLTLVVSFLYTFLIANYLGPEKYGAITYFISFVTGLAGALGFNFLIGTVSNYFPKGKPKRLFKLLLYGILGLSFLTFLALLISAIPILAFLGKSGVSLFQLTSILILLAPSFTLFTALFQGFKRFGSVLKVVGAESILNLAFAVVAVLFLNLDVYGVIYAKIASLIIAVALFAFLSKKLVFSKKPIDRKDLKRYLITFAPFSLVRGWEGQALTVLIGLFVGNFQLGLYYMAQKLASIAIATPINSLRDVLLPYSLEKSSDLKVIGNYASLNVKLALVVSILLSIALLALGWPVLYLLFPKFIEAYWLLPFFALALILSSFSILYVVYTSLNRLEYSAISAGVSLAIMLMAGYFLISSFGIYGAVLAETAYLASNGILLYYFLKRVKVSVSIIPGKKDLVFFYSKFKETFLKSIFFRR